MKLPRFQGLGKLRCRPSVVFFSPSSNDQSVARSAWRIMSKPVKPQAKGPPQPMLFSLRPFRPRYGPSISELKTAMISSKELGGYANDIISFLTVASQQLFLNQYSHMI